ncbi:exopolysaccharide biosynthesis polyprenyl glycosylphosphotransferase [Pontibacter korlensis]|uniref:Exopolysaccharide biosynthesis polyprenyl glycosylphosphotransferase n=1 Tax=Pontibacter korlensis TaxID=400092 RepID=A0A0E3UYE2_9BACT|nr:exopolysaccharide biosynthesis polyprenyl glycosylphosphotransferase [Pontibacter korlensis]AKD04396.1 exopolysaccharide biosynthesis polyprenyl glycosylphosphotransferase [Pontibacter korlensis]
MINSKPKISKAHLERDVVTLVLTIFMSIYIIENVVYIGADWLILLNVVVLGAMMIYIKSQAPIKLSEKRNLQLTRFIKAYAVLLSLAALLYLFKPLLFLTLFPDTNMFLAFVLGFPTLGVPLNLIVGAVLNKVKLNTERRKTTLVAGVGNLARNVEHELYGHDIKGYIKVKKEECLVKPEKVVGELEQIHEYLKDNPVDEIVIAIPVKPSKKIRNILMAADHYGVRVKYIPDYQNLFGEHYRTRRYGHLEAVHVRQLPLDGTVASLLKTSFDKVFSFLVLLALSPIFLVLAILIKFDSPGPVFYCPIRIGRGGKPFKCFKFRSMRESDSCIGGILSTQQNDPRITKLGRIMRKYSIDELPQFYNVLLGDMSVVGPRPHRSHLNRQLQESEDKYMIRHYYKPGITGWAQVNGWRGPTETKEQKSQRTLHDLWYMENWSMKLDFKIIYMTIFSRKVHSSAF